MNYENKNNEVAWIWLDDRLSVCDRSRLDTGWMVEDDNRHCCVGVFDSSDLYSTDEGVMDMPYHFIDRDELAAFIQQEIMTSGEAFEYLGISKQALNSLVQRGLLTPIKETNAIKLFLRSDLEQRKKVSDAWHKRS